MRSLTNTQEVNQYLPLRFKQRNYRFSILRSSIIQDKISEIGKIKLMTREFNLNADRKRFWLGRIESMDDEIMNESLPLSLVFKFVV